MPRARREVQTIDNPPPPLQPAVEDLFTPDENITRFLIEQAGGAEDAVVKVYKCGGPQPGQRPGQGTIRDAWLYQCAPAEFDEELLQGGYGAGKYRLRMYGTRHDGNYGAILNKVLEIGSLPPWKGNGAGVPALAGNGGVHVHAADSGASAIAKALAEANAPLIAAIATMMQHSGGSSRKEVMEEMRAMAEIMRPSDPLGNLGGLAKVMELAKSFAGNGDTGALTEESGPYAVLMKALETFGSMMQAAREQGALAAGAPAQLPAPAGKSENPPLSAADPKGAASQTVRTSESATSEENAQMETFLKMQLALFLNAAKAEGNPEIYAGLIVENAPEKLLDMMEAPGWFDELVKLAPEFAAHKPWCEQVRNIAMEALKETEEAAPAPDKADLPKTVEGSKTG